MSKKLAVFFILWLFCHITAGAAADVSLEEARVVAQNWLSHYVAVYGTWAGSASPVITSAEYLRYQEKLVGYNFLVFPK